MAAENHAIRQNLYKDVGLPAAGMPPGAAAFNSDPSSNVVGNHIKAWADKQGRWSVTMDAFNTAMDQAVVMSNGLFSKDREHRDPATVQKRRKSTSSSSRVAKTDKDRRGRVGCGGGGGFRQRTSAVLLIELQLHHERVGR